MNVAVVIPWRGGCAHREAALAWVHDRYTTAGLDVVVGEAAGPWCKARAVKAAVDATGAELVVVADADVWCDRLDEAIANVAAGHAWAVPHGPVHRLTDEATADVVHGGGSYVDGELEERPYLGHPGGGIVVLPRRTYLEVPLDAGFVGWGHEDDAWALALTTIAGRPWRGDAPLYHLWHPHQPRLNRKVGSAASRRRWQRYTAARGRVERMRRLVEEVPA